MGRVHLFELHEQPWFPTVWRDLLTDFLSFYAAVFKPYACVAPLLAEALRKMGAARIVDLCSGAGQPLVSILPALEELGFDDFEVTVTDKFPNLLGRRAPRSGRADGRGSLRVADRPGAVDWSEPRDLCDRGPVAARVSRVSSSVGAEARVLTAED